MDKKYSVIERDLQLQVSQLLAANNILINMLDSVSIEGTKIFSKEEFVTKTNEYLEKTFNIKGKSLTTRYDQ